MREGEIRSLESRRDLTQPIRRKKLPTVEKKVFVVAERGLISSFADSYIRGNLQPGTISERDKRTRVCTYVLKRRVTNVVLPRAKTRGDGEGTTAQLW